MDHLSERLREERKRVGLSQAAAASACDVRRQMWVRYEKGTAVPGSEVMSKFAAAGADILYVITGRRIGHMEMDRSRLALAIEAVEEGLSYSVRDMPPARKAELILAAYELIDEPEEQSRQRIIRLVRAA